MKVPSYVSAEATDLIHALLKFDGAQRLPLRNVLYHRWIQTHLTPAVKNRCSSNSLISQHFVCFVFFGWGEAYGGKRRGKKEKLVTSPMDVDLSLSLHPPPHDQPRQVALF